MEQRQFWSKMQLARELGVSGKTIERLCQSGKIREAGLEAFKIGHQWRIRRITVDSESAAFARWQHWDKLASLADRLVSAYDELIFCGGAPLRITFDFVIENKIDPDGFWFATLQPEMLFSHLRSEFPDIFGEFDNWNKFAASEITIEVIKKLRLVAARRAFPNSTCEVCCPET